MDSATTFHFEPNLFVTLRYHLQYSILVKKQNDPFFLREKRNYGLQNIPSVIVVFHFKITLMLHTIFVPKANLPAWMNYSSSLFTSKVWKVFFVLVERRKQLCVRYWKASLPHPHPITAFVDYYSWRTHSLKVLYGFVSERSDDCFCFFYKVNGKWL